MTLLMVDKPQTTFNLLNDVHELRNDDWLEDDVDWSSCHAVGTEYSQGMDTLWTWRDDIADMFMLR